MGSEEKGNHAYKLHPARIKQNVLCSWRKGEGLEFNRGVWFFEGTYACGLHLFTPACTCLVMLAFCFQFASICCLYLFQIDFFEGTYACGLHLLTPAWTCLFALVLLLVCTCLHMLAHCFQFASIPYAVSIYFRRYICMWFCFHMLFVFISDWFSFPILCLLFLHFHFAICILILLLDTFCIPYVSVYFYFFAFLCFLCSIFLWFCPVLLFRGHPK